MSSDTIMKDFITTGFHQPTLTTFEDPNLKVISNEMENYAGKNEDYCCKRCDDAADNAYYSRPLIN